jgi:hypothetical protein
MAQNCDTPIELLGRERPYCPHNRTNRYSLWSTIGKKFQVSPWLAYEREETYLRVSSLPNPSWGFRTLDALSIDHTTGKLCQLASASGKSGHYLAAGYPDWGPMRRFGTNFWISISLTRTGANDVRIVVSPVYSGDWGAYFLSIHSPRKVLNWAEWLLQ